MVATYNFGSVYNQTIVWFVRPIVRQPPHIVSTHIYALHVSIYIS